MAHIFTPGLKVTERAVVRRNRALPLSGEVLVAVGDEVDAETVVARAALPGKVFPLNLSNLLQVDPDEVPGCMMVKTGATIGPGAVLARSPGWFGWFRTVFKSPVAGTLEAVSSVTGQAMLRAESRPINVNAYMAGKIVDVVEGESVTVATEAAYLQGIFGLGGEAHGRIVMLASSPGAQVKASDLQDAHRGAILVCGASIDRETFEAARDLGVTAIVVGGIEYAMVKALLGRELGVAITGTERMGTTLILTEGFGHIDMAPATFALLAAQSGRMAAVNGATQIRAGVMRPEIIIPHDDQLGAVEADAPGSGLRVGGRVRGIRHPHFGSIGEVSELPTQLQTLDSGARVRVLEVRFDDGKTAIVPRANVEAIEA